MDSGAASGLRVVLAIDPKCVAAAARVVRGAGGHGRAAPPPAPCQGLERGARAAAAVRGRHHQRGPRGRAGGPPGDCASLRVKTGPRPQPVRCRREEATRPRHAAAGAVQAGPGAAPPPHRRRGGPHHGALRAAGGRRRRPAPARRPCLHLLPLPPRLSLRRGGRGVCGGGGHLRPRCPLRRDAAPPVPPAHPPPARPAAHAVRRVRYGVLPPLPCPRRPRVRLAPVLRPTHWHLPPSPRRAGEPASLRHPTHARPHARAPRLLQRRTGRDHAAACPRP